MTSGTDTAACRDTGLQRRCGGMAQRTVIQVRCDNRAIHRHARIVTVQTCGRATENITERHVISATMNGQVLVAVTVQTVGRVATRCDRRNNFGSRAVVTGRTGAGAVGRNIMLGSFDLGPARDHVTDTAQLARGIVGQVPCSFSDGMTMSGMEAVEPGRMAGSTVTASGKVIADRKADQAAVQIVTAGAGVVVGRITSIGQWWRIAVTVATTGAGATGAADSHQAVMARQVGAVGQRPAALMTGRAVATRYEGLTRGAADPDAIHIVTAAAGIVNLRITGIG